MTKRKEQADAARAAIIEAGRELLSQREAKDIKIKDIMKACSLSPGLFYHYFESKDAFIVTLVTESWDRSFDILNDPDIPPLRRLREYCTVVLQSLMNVDPQLRRNLNTYRMSDVYTKEREIHYRDDAMMNSVEEYMRDWIAKGEFSSDLPVEYIAKLLVYIVHGIDFNASLYKREWTDWSWCDEFFDHVEESLLKPYLLK